MLTYLYALQWLICLGLLVLLDSARRDRDCKQNIVEAQEQTLSLRNERIKLQDEIIAKQRRLIEEKMTEKVKEAFEKPKSKRGRPRKNP